MAASDPRATLPTGSEERKGIPLATGVLDYFPAALAEVARLSKAGNDKHNPGEELHWSRGKSTDHADTILRHLADRGLVDPEDGIRHSTKVAWRALALLQEELEREAGANAGRASRFPITNSLVQPGQVFQVDGDPKTTWKDERQPGEPARLQREVRNHPFDQLMGWRTQ